MKAPLTAEQVILKLVRELQRKRPHYREDTEALQAAREWLQGNRAASVNTWHTTTTTGG